MLRIALLPAPTVFYLEQKALNENTYFALEFYCADVMGSFYIKIISIIPINNEVE